jgi:hypothetical protein
MPLDTRTLQAYLGHRSIGSTTRYAALAPGRFKNICGEGIGTMHRITPQLLGAECPEHADGLPRGVCGRGSYNCDWDRRRDLEYEVVIIVR